MNLLEVFTEVKESFCSLWKAKYRGNTLEIITHYTSPDSKFISVFITERDGKYIVTDGGWLMSGEYYESSLLKTKEFDPLLFYYTSFYKLRKTSNGVNDLYFSSTSEIDMVPNKVHDLAQFISQSLYTFHSLYEIDQAKDVQQREKFLGGVNNFLERIYLRKDDTKLQFGKSLGPKYESVRFNAIATEADSKIVLVKYITGVTPDYYRRSLTNATVDFDIATGSDLNSFIKNKVAIIDDQVSGFQVKKILPYVRQLEKSLDHEVSRWSNKGEIIDMFT
ncbi:hypothetical protein SAMN05444008_102421 [Cnuella takakiae]|uniref:DUF1828 domain-containing protein n=1 Tax=Cnuella takakiae TaxID=1302690 RepID=A0A1M4VYQ0_9BACT|nr:hypothetical protein [Cnuella takakiae]OLY92466.1 hypothetical protein BUE76_11645 [Cnuella takakiae]SHE73842.1 hypothetical protein SAMN05444008_102421 [Cnuella takakiae]